MLSLRSRMTNAVTLAIVALLGGMTTTSHADIPPNFKPAPQPKIQITSRNALSTAVLIIPRSMITGSEKKVSDAGMRTSTIISGLAISSGIMLCGVVLLRRRNGGAVTMAAVMVASLGLVGGGSYLMANAPPPPSAFVDPAKQPPNAQTLLEETPVAISISDTETLVTLVLRNDTKLKLPTRTEIVPR